MSSARVSQASLRRTAKFLAAIGIGNVLVGLFVGYLAAVIYPVERDISELPFEGFVVSIVAGVVTSFGIIAGVVMLFLALCHAFISLFNFDD